MQKPLITLANINHSLTTEEGRVVHVLRDVSLSVHEGEFCMLVGPSGSGKSTLLRIMSGLERDYRGSLTLDASVSKAATSFVFQQFALMPWLTVYKNIELSLIAHNTPHADRAGIVKKWLETLGLTSHAHAYPRELSGGLRQRVGIARAFCTNPKIIFLDEPFSELDSFTAAELRSVLLSLWMERKPTIVMVTHLIGEALELGDKIAILSKSPAIVETTLHNPLARPRNERSPEFFAEYDKIKRYIKP